MKPRRSFTPVVVALASALATLMIPGGATAQTAGGTPSPGAASSQKVIRGTVVYREKVVLPQNAELIMRLVDISNPAKPVVVAESTMPTAGRQVPIPFTLPFDPAKVTGGLNALKATIVVDGKIQFVTGARVILQPDKLPEALAISVVAGDAEPGTGDTSIAPSAGPPPITRDPNIPQRQRKQRPASSG